MSTAAVKILSRSDWGARAPKKAADNRKGPAQYVIVHHSAGCFASDKGACTEQVQSFQNLHMDTNKWDDIGYNFVVGEDGNAYEGRGWNAVGAHAKGFNALSIGICVIGNFNTREPNSAAVDAVQGLIRMGVAQGVIDPKYALKGHRDVGVTECPGDHLYALIQKWSQYAPGKPTL